MSRPRSATEPAHQDQQPPQSSRPSAKYNSTPERLLARDFDGSKATFAASPDALHKRQRSSELLQLPRTKRQAFATSPDGSHKTTEAFQIHSQRTLRMRGVPLDWDAGRVRSFLVEHFNPTPGRLLAPDLGGSKDAFATSPDASHKTTEAFQIHSQGYRDPLDPVIQSLALEIHGRSGTGTLVLNAASPAHRGVYRCLNGRPASQLVTSIYY